ncbi:gluconate permease [Aerococcus sanguinicola]|uniref:Gluconate permease n=1 Tax=Aerococcus sanguinicola TaxID=119206 RepID=A0A2I1MLW8_9LACT|nr:MULTISPECIES: gluconate:H+ symporter [Aerococcus]MDK7050542.1 gluconate:H+ symporter [Aerococcus sanguinicola]OFT97185.1 gluconate permease [Aerococcus sp. HMSC23C02]PKZ21136.1 gluconate permease [Aerococcus sanguinicola]
MSASTQIILALIFAMVLLIFMLTKTKIHVFLALIITSLLTGILGGMDPIETVNTIKEGFGTTLGNLGILISFGVMMGKLLEKSGAAERIARSFLKVFGNGKEEMAVNVTGYITSMSIFCVPGFVILFPLLKVISRAKRKSIVSLAIATAGGLVLTHSIVVPATGPIGTAGIFGADLAQMMFWGIVITIPMAIALVIYARYMGKQIYRLPDESGEGWLEGDQARALTGHDIAEEQTDQEELPGTLVSFAPIIVPILLILAGTFATQAESSSFIVQSIAFLGQPVCALGISLLIAIIFLSRSMTRDQALAFMDEGIAGGAKILLIVGAGGALGTIVNASGAGDVIANYIAGTAIPPILLPLIISTLVRFIQGSGNVAAMTAASITAPIMATLGVSPVFAALAACVGSMFFSYFNDSYFWTLNELIGNEKVKDQIRTWSIPTTICWAIGAVMILVLNAFFG